MQLTIISGLSGAGKSVALNTLEDEGYYCIDNLPNSMLLDLAKKMLRNAENYDRVAIGIDARGEVELLQEFQTTLGLVHSLGLKTKVVFLDALDATLVTRFSETRRKHPLSKHGAPLEAALVTERAMLSNVEQNSDVRIDTTNLNLHQLREVMRKQVIGLNQAPVNVLLQSFGFKHGPPQSTDFIFDVRCLPNPYWSAPLRPLTGQDQPVADFLHEHDPVNDMIEDISAFFIKWTPVFEQENRAYLTVSIGCTGGRHRSVYVVERVWENIKTSIDQITVKHREIS